MGLPFVSDGYPNTRQFGGWSLISSSSSRPSMQPQVVALDHIASLTLPAGFTRLDGSKMPEEPPGIWKSHVENPDVIFLYFDAWVAAAYDGNLLEEVRRRHDTLVAEAKRSKGWRRYAGEHSPDQLGRLESRATRPWMEWGEPLPFEIAGSKALLLSGSTQDDGREPWFDEERVAAAERHGTVCIVRVRAQAIADHGPTPEQIEASMTPERRREMYEQMRAALPDMSDTEWEQARAVMDESMKNRPQLPPSSQPGTARAADELMQTVLDSWKWLDAPR